MTIIPFGEWTPDQPDLSAGATVAKNVFPAAASYKPVKDISIQSTAADARITGMGGAEDSAGNAFSFVGDSTKLYRYSGGTLNNVSKSGNYTTAAGERWAFAEYGTRVIASNFSDPIQSFSVGSSSLFADLAAAAPRARTIATVRDFLVCGNIFDSGDFPNRVRWSALGDPTNWTTSTTTQSDHQDIFEGGSVLAIAGGEYGVVFLDRSVVRMSYVGAPLIFQFDQVASNRGLAARDAFTRVGDITFFLDRDGFYAFNGQTIQPIGVEKVDRYFWNDVNSNYLERITCASDPDNGLIFWSYPSTNSSDGEPDRIMVYNWRIGRWSYIEVDHQMVGKTLSVSYTLEQLDTINSNIDNHTVSFDSPVYQGGQIQISVAKDNKLGSFTGANLAAIIETPESAVADTRRALVRSVRPIVDGGTLTVQAAARNRVNDTFTFGTAAAQNAAGFCPLRSEGRYHRVRVNIAAGGTWNHAQGIEFDAVAGGLR